MQFCIGDLVAVNLDRRCATAGYQGFILTIIEDKYVVVVFYPQEFMITLPGEALVLKKHYDTSPFLTRHRFATFVIPKEEAYLDHNIMLRYKDRVYKGLVIEVNETLLKATFVDHSNRSHTTYLPLETFVFA